MRRRIMKKFLFIVMTALLSTQVFAQEVKQARANDVASKYTLKSNGDFFRTVKKNECQITNKVESFKVSQHPKDAAVVYFKKDKDLYVLHNVTGDVSNCPKTSKKVIMSSVKKYTVVSNTKTVIVNMALDIFGKLVAWGNTNVLITLNSVSNYVHNECYGVDGKSFNSFVAFAISKTGTVTKIRGGENGVVESKVDTNSKYADLEDFKRTNNVCK